MFRVYDDDDQDDGEEPDLSNWDVIPKDEIELKHEVSIFFLKMT